MRHIILSDGENFRLERWGGGLSYLLTHKPTCQSTFIQGDDATQFEAELEAAELAFPNNTPDQINAWLWDQLEYGTVAQPDPSSLDDFTKAYIECALWLLDEDPGSGQGQGFEDWFPKLAPETIAAMIADCDQFREDTIIVNCIGNRETQAGHDFWLTRNRHGAGFWDTGRWPEPDCDMLTTRAHGFGESDLYIGDDGRIYS